MRRTCLAQPKKDLPYGSLWHFPVSRQSGQRNGTDIWSCHVTTNVLETGLESFTEVEPMSRITSIPPTSTQSRRLQILPERSEASTTASIPSIPFCPLEINLEHPWISSPVCYVCFMIHDFVTELIASTYSISQESDSCNMSSATFAVFQCILFPKPHLSLSKLQFQLADARAWMHTYVPNTKMQYVCFSNMHSVWLYICIYLLGACPSSWWDFPVASTKYLG